MRYEFKISCVFILNTDDDGKGREETKQRIIRDIKQGDYNLNFQNRAIVSNGRKVK